VETAVVGRENLTFGYVRVKEEALCMGGLVLCEVGGGGVYLRQ